MFRWSLRVYRNCLGGRRRSCRGADADQFSRARDWISLLFCGIGLKYLVKSRLRYETRLRILGLVFFAFGIFSSSSCLSAGLALPTASASQPHVRDLETVPFLDAGYTVPGVFLTLLIFMGIVTVIGNKLFCGWSCPIGAVQEIVHRIPLPKGWKRKLPFKTANSVRAVNLLFLIAVFSMSIDLYDYVNPFEALHWDFEIWMTGVLLVVLAAALFAYRPYCYFLRPRFAHLGAGAHFDFQSESGSGRV